MTTVGKLLDKPDAKKIMDPYFERMSILAKKESTVARIRFALMDVIDLRQRKWVPKREIGGPKTIAQVHQDEIKKKEAKEAEVERKLSKRPSQSLRIND